MCPFSFDGVGLFLFLSFFIAASLLRGKNRRGFKKQKKLYICWGWLFFVIGACVNVSCVCLESVKICVGAGMRQEKGILRASPCESEDKQMNRGVR